MRIYNFGAIGANFLIKFWGFIVDVISKIHISRVNISQENLIKELRGNFKEIAIIETSNLKGSEKIWALNCNKLKQNIEGLDPRTFLQWKVVKDSMFVQESSFIRVELKKIINDKSANINWQDALKENYFGAPQRMLFNFNFSSNLIHHAYHFYNFQRNTNSKITEFELIFEFGGGYGSLARLANQMGFSGQYIIFDLPNFSFLQRYYLKNLGYNILTYDQLINGKKGVYCISDIEDVFALSKYFGEIHKSLFIATWSYSETPLEFRSQFINIISQFNVHLIAYQEVFEKIDNKSFFKNLQRLISSSNWNDFEVDTLPGNRYLFGRKN
jgi:hypothetical protein